MNACLQTLTCAIDEQGTLRCLYSEVIDLSELGRLRIERASHIEFDEVDQQWQVRLPDGKHVYSNSSREACLDWERRFFNQSR